MKFKYFRMRLSGGKCDLTRTETKKTALENKQPISKAANLESLKKFFYFSRFSFRDSQSDSQSESDWLLEQELKDPKPAFVAQTPLR